MGDNTREIMHNERARRRDSLNHGQNVSGFRSMPRHQLPITTDLLCLLVKRCCSIHAESAKVAADAAEADYSRLVLLASLFRSPYLLSYRQISSSSLCINYCVYWNYLECSVLENNFRTVLQGVFLLILSHFLIEESYLMEIIFYEDISVSKIILKLTKFYKNQRYNRENEQYLDSVDNLVSWQAYF